MLTIRPHGHPRHQHAGNKQLGHKSAARKIASLAIGGLIVVGVSNGCSAENTSTPSQSATANPTPNASSISPTPSPVPTPSPTPTPTPTSPLTGLAQESPQPVLVVKLDNTRNAQPHAGLRKADLVYIEEVEYGITRLAAVFNSRIPDRIGPVRSARITDIDLLTQYGSPAFAYSGAQRKLLPELASAPFVDLSANKSANSYSRDFSRRAPYNYFLNGKTALKGVSGVSVDQSIGFTFSETPPLGGTPLKSAAMRWSYASAKFVYEPETNNYAVLLNDERASAEEGDGLQWADTAIIQFVKQSPSQYFDRGGGNTPHAKTIGKGKALILRDGQLFKANWSRPSADSGTLFTNDAGIPIDLKPGQTWIALFDKTREVRLKTPKATHSPSSTTTNPAASLSATPSSTGEPR